MVEDSKSLLTSMGILVVEAASEGEAGDGIRTALAPGRMGGQFPGKRDCRLFAEGKFMGGGISLERKLSI